VGVVVCLTCDRRDVCELSPHQARGPLPTSLMSANARPDWVDYAVSQYSFWLYIESLEILR
jgi:hypothetical protein